MAAGTPKFDIFGEFETLSVRCSDALGVALLELNRPSASNAMNMPMVAELPAAIQALDTSPGVRCIVVAGAGKHFCAGLDFRTMAEVLEGGLGADGQCPAEQRRSLLARISAMQVLSQLPCVAGMLYSWAASVHPKRLAVCRQPAPRLRPAASRFLLRCTAHASARAWI